MAAVPHMTSQTFQALDVAPREDSAGTTDTRTELARLASLHDEARQTAQLANELGRAPLVAAGLASAAGLVVAIDGAVALAAEAISWLILMLIAVGAIARCYSQAIKAPFERAPLMGFARDMNAVMLYAGCAWGAGAFLVLPETTGSLGLVLFSAGMAGLVAISLRTRDASLWFVAPSTTLATFASVLRPMDGGALASSAALVACVAVAALIIVTGRKLTATAVVPYFTG